MKTCSEVSESKRALARATRPGCDRKRRHRALSVRFAVGRTVPAGSFGALANVVQLHEQRSPSTQPRAHSPTDCGTVYSRSSTAEHRQKPRSIFARIDAVEPEVGTFDSSRLCHHA